MNAAELRTGNYVYDAENKMTIVKGIDWYGNILRDCKTCDDEFESFEPFPIPLTPEILLKCGFEKAKGQVTFWYYKIKNINLSFRLLNGVLIYKIDSSFNLEINSLHQLQNLYFAIVGEELICTL